mmetsp:Transcript_46261/g.53321  ORF Transcript_46261/g.53321 Transcript_46261/m.53321 type:complete len:81 (+) Transcript_46261:383-625(+)
MPRLIQISSNKAKMALSATNNQNVAREILIRNPMIFGRSQKIPWSTALSLNDDFFFQILFFRSSVHPTAIFFDILWPENL